MIVRGVMMDSLFIKQKVKETKKSVIYQVGGYVNYGEQFYKPSINLVVPKGVNCDNTIFDLIIKERMREKRIFVLKKSDNLRVNYIICSTILKNKKNINIDKDNIILKSYNKKNIFIVYKKRKEGK